MVRIFLLSLLSLAAFAASAQVQDESLCFENAATRFHLPVLLLRAVRDQEAGSPGFVRSNRNGSFDYGVMQINSLWLPEIRELGYSAHVLTHSACDSIMAGAWILANQMQRLDVWNKRNVDPADYWRAVGAYHSRTPHLNQRYAKRVWSHFVRLKKEHKKAIEAERKLSNNASVKKSLVSSVP